MGLHVCRGRGNCRCPDRHCALANCARTRADRDRARVDDGSGSAVERGNMSCNNVREQLSAWVDGELSPATMQALEAHLSACATCRAHAVAIRALKHAIA